MRTVGKSIVKESVGATGKALHLLRDIIDLQGEPFNPESYSKKSGVPVPNLYRYLTTLLENGVLIRPRRGAAGAAAGEAAEITRASACWISCCSVVSL